MHQQQRTGVRALARHVQEMHIDVVQRRLELWKRIEPRLLGTPVERGAPVLDQSTQVVDVRAIGPGLARRLIGEPRARKTLAQIGDRGIGDVQGEGFRPRTHPAVLHRRRDLMPRAAFWQPA